MHFTTLDDSPMFRKQLQALEESAEALRERCQRLYKGCRKYSDGLGEAYDGDIAFASGLETFGGGHDDPISVAVGGPVMTKFTIALREIGTYKEVLRSQVEHMLNDRLTQFVSIDLQDVKEVRKRFDKASLHYDQVREKFLSLRKDAKVEVVSEAQEDLWNAKSQFEQARFNLITALSNIEAKKKFEFLEAVSGSMDAHLRYFKQGYELLHQIEPYIHQVLTYAQQSRERANYEQAALADRMQEYRQQMDQENQRSFSHVDSLAAGDGIQAVGRSSHKLIEAVMQSTPRGQIQTIKQGYLLKRSSNLRADWKRRFFVLDSRGMLYYYRKQWGKPTESERRMSFSCCLFLLETELFAVLNPSLAWVVWLDWLQDDKTIAHHTVNLLTSTIKIDAEQSDLRFCFRIVSPSKIYTLQAENAVDRMDWVDKITGVIASLLNNQVPEQVFHFSYESSTGTSLDIDGTEDTIISRVHSSSSYRDQASEAQLAHEPQEKPLDILRCVPGNDVCADCGAVEPDWASLNLGILLCIECSGVHRNLGVQISKVRSLTLDVKVWEPSVIGYFQSIGNACANSIWEEGLTIEGSTQNLSLGQSAESEPAAADVPILKPDARDPLPVKEKFIQAKYVEKRFVKKLKVDLQGPTVARQMWDAVQMNKQQLALRLLITADANPNTTLEQAMGTGEPSRSPLLATIATALSRRNNSSQNSRSNWGGSLVGNHSAESATELQTAPLSPVYRAPTGNLAANEQSGTNLKDTRGCTLLHLSCQIGDLSLIELLLQHGARVNITDAQGRTPLHYCILSNRNLCAKLLLTRGSNPAATDSLGKTPLESAMEQGAITDDELFVMLSEPSR
ncbi:unnamed protein product [Sphagnum jensenii]|uniref:Uncharacterized protein n=1 Tax=Sphagnum jensenii TaxID=128206 RepID=A0ABP0W6V5_9BRYO